VFQYVDDIDILNNMDIANYYSVPEFDIPYNVPMAYCANIYAVVHKQDIPIVDTDHRILCLFYNIGYRDMLCDILKERVL
jgi:hypothetical protein